MLTCTVAGCSRRSGRRRCIVLSHTKSYHWQRIQEGTAQQTMQRLYDRVCSRHFVTGKPAIFEDELHPDRLPTRHLGKLQHIHTSNAESVERYERLKRRQELKAGDKNDTESVRSETNNKSVHKIYRGTNRPD